MEGYAQRPHIEHNVIMGCHSFEADERERVDGFVRSFFILLLTAGYTGGVIKKIAAARDAEQTAIIIWIRQKKHKNERETENMKHLMRVTTDLTEKMLDEIIYPMCDM